MAFAVWRDWPWSISAEAAAMVWQRSCAVCRSPVATCRGGRRGCPVGYAASDRPATVTVVVDPPVVDLPVVEDVVPAQSVKFVETPSPKATAGQPLRGPNTSAADTRLAALQQGTAPEVPAVKARREPSAPAKPEAKLRPAKAPALPPAVSPKISKAAPVPVIVARTLTRKIPDSHIGLPVQQQKDSFVSIILPLILAANEEIGQRRSAIMRAADAQDLDALQRWAKLYRVNTDGKSVEEIRTNILDRADFIPVSLALAQAAIESGWGHRALQGREMRCSASGRGRQAKASSRLRPQTAVRWCAAFPISSVRFGPICTI